MYVQISVHIFQGRAKRAGRRLLVLWERLRTPSTLSAIELGLAVFDGLRAEQQPQVGYVLLLSV